VLVRYAGITAVLQVSDSRVVEYNHFMMHLDADVNVSASMHKNKRIDF